MQSHGSSQTKQPGWPRRILPALAFAGLLYYLMNGGMSKIADWTAARVPVRTPNADHAKARAQIVDHRLHASLSRRGFEFDLILGQLIEQGLNLPPRKYGRRFFGIAQVINGQVYSGYHVASEAQVQWIDVSFVKHANRIAATEKSLIGDYVLASQLARAIQQSVETRQLLTKRYTKDPAQQELRLACHADFIAGVLVHHSDPDEASQEAWTSALGAVRESESMLGTGRPPDCETPGEFAVGTLEQRVAWFQAGLESGNADRAVAILAVQQ